MNIKQRSGISLAEAKATFENGNVGSIRIDIVLGNYYLVVCTKITEKTLVNARNKEKVFKSLDAIIKDYRYITSMPINTMIIK